MIGYASRTGTRRNLDALRRAGWRLMVSAKGPLRPERFRYALDNGAWTAFQRASRSTCPRSRRRFLCSGRGPTGSCCPTSWRAASLRCASLDWLDALRNRPELRDAQYLLAVQNGMEPPHVAAVVGPEIGIFVGGDTPWKLATMATWARLAHERGAICHVGRVNTARRIRLCAAAGADSFDGSGVSRFASALPPLDLARRQPDIEAWLAGQRP
ncbi:hypothetical protein [Caballeronia sp. CLC5]|uniref:hypothetical protein n=1 Tax=Caballeronia sp. CLC5 TaxID=2906764 RepID=UPI001F286B3D|nr:hypothetical protein [Caballeronia sp. CLC5]MCE4570493.1 hypothetical protein [Caballeronia sp. CLC5]